MEDFELKGLKPLPRDADGEISRYFTANGNKYKICDVDEILSPWRMVEWQRMSIVAGYNMSFDVLMARLKELEERIYAVTEVQSSKTPAILLLNGINNGIISSGSDRWENVAIFSTLFIVREGENLSEWHLSDANDKVSDWNTEGYKMEDFFFLTIVRIQKFKEAYLGLIKEKMEMNQLGILSENMQ